MELLDHMLDHDRWATSLLLEASSRLTDAQLDQSFDIGHGTLRETFSHIIFNMLYWTTFLTGDSGYNGYSTDNLPSDRSIPDLVDFHDRHHAEFTRIVRRLRDECRQDETFVDEWSVRPQIGGRDDSDSARTQRGAPT